MESKSLFLISLLVLLTFIVRQSIAAPALPDNIQRQWACVGGVTSEGNRSIHEPEFQSHPILSYWLSRVIDRAKDKENTFFVPIQMSISPDGRQLVLFTKDYQDPGKKKNLCDKDIAYDDLPRSSVFIISGDKIKEFLFESMTYGSQILLWRGEKWTDNSHLLLKTAPYEHDANGSFLLDVNAAGDRYAHYIHGVPYGGYRYKTMVRMGKSPCSLVFCRDFKGVMRIDRDLSILTIDPSVWNGSARSTVLGRDPGWMKPNILHFYLYNARKGRYCTLGTVDVSHGPAKDKLIKYSDDARLGFTGFSNGNSIVKTINDVRLYNAAPGHYIAPMITGVHETSKEIVIRYQYKLSNSSPVLNQYHYKLNIMLDWSPLLSATLSIDKELFDIDAGVLRERQT